jgi:hypothetical protein
MDASLRVTPLSKRWWALVAGASVVLASIGAAPAWAEDAPIETPPSEPAAEAEYVPPPEAHEGVGGWAVVDPATGNVHGVIVGTIETFHSVQDRGGMGHEYMGCHANCVLRFQTRATADGNVAGWHGTQTHIDSQGNASQSNDGSVKWNPSTSTFSINNQVTGGQRSMTLVPERTARDAGGMDLGTGIIDIETLATREANGQTGRVRILQRDLASPQSEVGLVFPLWSPEGKAFSYILSNGWLDASGENQAALDRISEDVDNALLADGYTTNETVVDEETGEEVITTVIDGESSFVQAIRTVTQSVVTFLGDVFGLNRWSEPASE